MLSKLLNEFNNITVELNDLLENNKIESLEELLEKRQSVIDEINSLKYSKDEFQEIVNEIHLVEEEKKLGELLKIKLAETKREIEDNKREITKVGRQRAVNKMYGNVNMNPLDPVFVSKKY